MDKYTYVNNIEVNSNIDETDDINNEDNPVEEELFL